MSIDELKEQIEQANAAIEIKKMALALAIENRSELRRRLLQLRAAAVEVPGNQSPSQAEADGECGQ